MANPTYPSTEAKRQAKAKLDAAAANFKAAREVWHEAKEAYNAAKAKASLERRAHFDSIQERRLERLRKQAEPKVRKPYDMTNRSKK